MHTPVLTMLVDSLNKSVGLRVMFNCFRNSETDECITEYSVLQLCTCFIARAPVRPECGLACGVVFVLEGELDVVTVEPRCVDAEVRDADVED